MHPSWRSLLVEELGRPAGKALVEFIREERRTHVVYPKPDDVLRVFDIPYHGVRAVILGQDPYHGDGQAHGLSFSVPVGVKIPPSLRNIHKELHDDLGCPIPPHGNLQAWADRGVFLLNTVLTVRAGEPGSHRDRGWEGLTEAVLRRLNDREEPVAVILWGSFAARVASGTVDKTRHVVITSAHPSPMSAHNGFLGSRPFSKINEALRARGCQEIDWSLT